jgi:hypothetical protein
MIKTFLASLSNGHELQNYEGIDGTTCLGVMTFGEANGHFNSEVRNSTGTTIMIPVRAFDGISLTDIIVTTDKTQGGLFSLSLTDDVESETLVSGAFSDAPVSVNLSVRGRFESWQGCRLDLDTTSTGVVSCTVGYFRVPEVTARTYVVWNSER